MEMGVAPVVRVADDPAQLLAGRWGKVPEPAESCSLLPALLDSAAAFTGGPGISGLPVSGCVWCQRANFSMAAGVTGVKKLTRLPSGSRNNSDRLPQGIVVGLVTKSVTKPVRFW